MAITVTIQNVKGMLRQNSDPAKITIDCTSAANGVVTGGVAATYAAASTSNPQISKVSGYIRKIEWAPGLNGDGANNLPTDQCDFTLNDSYGYDVAAGYLANQSGNNAGAVVPVSPIFVDTELTLNGANMGNATKGRIIIHLAN